jgi:hypothetical protein
MTVTGFNVSKRTNEEKEAKIMTELHHGHLSCNLANSIYSFFLRMLCSRDREQYATANLDALRRILAAEDNFIKFLIVS